MTASASPSNNLKTAPKTPDVARRHYVTSAWRLRAAVIAARAQAAEPETVADLAERLAEARTLAARARSWGSRYRARMTAARDPHAGRRKARKVRPPLTARDTEISVGRRIVTDPETIGAFVEVQVNRQLDVLTMEHCASPPRISDVEFAVGRLLQDAWTGARSDRDGRLNQIAKLGVLPDGSAAEGVESLPSREMHMLREAFRVRAVSELDAKIAGVVGWVGVRFLKAILVEGHTFKTYAGCTVGGGERAVSRVGDRFRWLLEAVADSLHTATGAEGQRIRAMREPA